MLKKTIVSLLLPGLIAGIFAGCRTIEIPPVGQTNAPERIDDQGYQKTLSAYVCDGLIRYKKLKDDRGSLDEYLRTIERAGPTATPGLFKDPQEELAFWINSYNAAGLRAAVDRYPASSVRSGWQDFENNYRVRIDGRQMTLADIAAMARRAGAQDPRIEAALTLPAKGSPKLSPEVYKGSTIDQQLDEAMVRAIKDPSQVMIDHENKTIRLSRAIYRVRDQIIAAYCRRNRTTDGSIINALAEYGDVTERRRLNAAIGYRAAEIPFDWSLNDNPEPSCSLNP